MAASATFALKAGVWFRRARLLIVSPDSRVNLARRQAETPLIPLFRFLRPALGALGNLRDFWNRHDCLGVQPSLDVASAIETGSANFQVPRATPEMSPCGECRRLDADNGGGLFLP